MIQEIRQAAVCTASELVRFNLNLCAAELQAALDRLAEKPTSEHLEAVNGHWAHAVRLIDFANNKKHPEPKATA